MDDQTNEQLLTRSDLRARLNERGYKISQSYFDYLCLPSRNLGPKPAKWFGARPLYRFSEGLAWAESRCSSERGKLIAA